MTDPQTGEVAYIEPVDEELDTTTGQRDPLTTDDGLAAVAETMPAVDEHDTQDDDLTGNPGRGSTQAAPVDAPGLEVGADGVDPLTELARPGDQKES